MVFKTIARHCCRDKSYLASGNQKARPDALRHPTFPYRCNNIPFRARNYSQITSYNLVYPVSRVDTLFHLKNRCNLIYYNNLQIR